MSMRPEVWVPTALLTVSCLYDSCLIFLQASRSSSKLELVVLLTVTAAGGGAEGVGARAEASSTRGKNWLMRPLEPTLGDAAQSGGEPTQCLVGVCVGVCSPALRLRPCCALDGVAAWLQETPHRQPSDTRGKQAQGRTIGS